MLRREVGDEAFFEGIRSYYAALRDDAAWSADFERAMEEAAGEDLGWFFAQWLTRPGHPVLAVSTEPRGSATQVVVRQVQPGEPWRIQVELAVEGSGGSHRERIEMTGREAAIELAAQVPIEHVMLDPDAWLLYEPAP
jgi:aminopeptidase N